MRRIPARSIQPGNDPNRLIAEATAPHVASVIVQSIQQFKRRLTDADIYRGLAHGSLIDAIREPFNQFKRDLNGSKIFLANAHMQAQSIAERNLAGVISKATVEFDLDALPQSTQDALDDYDYSMIREVTDDVLASISDAMTNGIQQGLPPYAMAAEIRDSVGLTDSQQAAVANYRKLLTNGSQDALTRELRDEQYDDIVEAAVQSQGVAPLATDMVNRLVARYQDRYINYRANTIARYESLSITNQGASDGVQTGVDSGSIDPSTIRTRWLIAQDELVCPSCRSIVELQPEGVPFGTPFQWRTLPKGKRGIMHEGSVMLAPLHPLCRCTTTFRIVSLGSNDDYEQ
jgi:hypothetical protein